MNCNAMMFTTTTHSYYLHSYTVDLLLQCVTADLAATHHQVYIATAGSVMKGVHTTCACNCVKSATLVAIDETNIVAVDLTNVCESHDSVVLCSLVIGHMHIIKDLAGGC